jgi:AcrR family transcriptional regulator
MARPRAFDRDAALRAAMKVFWDKGYEATSTEALLEAMGIGRQSLYNTFGDKRRLYLEALQLYTAGNLGALLEQFRRAASAMQVLRELMLAAAAPDDAARGCLGLHAICEFGTADAEVAEIGAASSRVLLTALEDLLRDGQRRGEIAPGLEPRQAAHFLYLTMLGIKAGSRAGHAAEMLRDTAELALQRLQPG